MNPTRLICAAVALLAFAVYPAQAQEAPTGEFNLSTTVNGDGTLTPTLSWSTTPAAQSCAASGDDEWTGDRPASGSETLTPQPRTQPRNFMMVCTFPGETQAILMWTAPTQNTDGSALTNLAGHRVHWGTAFAALTQSAQVPGASVNTFTISELTAGTWFFGVTAYTTQGAESALSNIASKTMRAPVEWSQSIGIKTPQPPVLGTVE